MRIFYQSGIFGALATITQFGVLSAQNPASASTAGTAPGTTPGTATTAAKTSTAQAPTFDPALLHPANLTERAPAVFEVQFTTTRGSFVVTVTRAWAPLGADRFYSLVKHHYYDNASFFRVLRGFVAQFGISAYPQVTTAWKEAVFKDDPVTQTNRRGYVVFATRGPNTRTTQLFINLADNGKSLDARGFAPFGQVTSGMAVVDSLYHGYGEGGAPGGGPAQPEMEQLGKPYIDKGWPKLDTIKKARLVTSTSATATSSTPATTSAPATKK